MKKSIENYIDERPQETPVNFKANSEKLEQLKSKLKKKKIKLKDFWNAAMDSYLAEG